MRWAVFVLGVLGVLSIMSILGVWQNVDAKAPRTVMLSEVDVATVKTALGYTTLLNFDGRPSSVVLGDQDAFKVEYVGNGLAIKPLQGGAKTNLFVFTDYDRFNFRLVAGATADADYLLRIRRSSPAGDQAPSRTEPIESAPSLLTRKTVNRRAVCGGVTLRVRTVAWPASQSTLLVYFRAQVDQRLVKKVELRFQPGDFEIWQDGRSLPIESLHLDRLVFTASNPMVEGTLVLRQSEFSKGRGLKLAFVPDLLQPKTAACLKVSFLSQGGA